MHAKICCCYADDASNKPSDPVTTSDPIMLLAAAAAAIDGRPTTNGTHAPSSNNAYTSTSERRLGDSGYGRYIMLFYLFILLIFLSRILFTILFIILSKDKATTVFISCLL